MKKQQQVHYIKEEGMNLKQISTNTSEGAER